MWVLELLSDGVVGDDSSSRRHLACLNTLSESWHQDSQKENVKRHSLGTVTAVREEGGPLKF